MSTTRRDVFKRILAAFTVAPLAKLLAAPKGPVDTSEYATATLILPGSVAYDDHVRHMQAHLQAHHELMRSYASTLPTPDEVDRGKRYATGPCSVPLHEDSDGKMTVL